VIRDTGRGDRELFGGAEGEGLFRGSETERECDYPFANSRRREEAAELVWRREVGRGEHDLQHSAADKDPGRNRSHPAAVSQGNPAAAAEQVAEVVRNQQVPAAELNRLRLSATAEPHAERAIGVG
jgi:hypothetical protein